MIQYYSSGLPESNQRHFDIIQISSKKKLLQSNALPTELSPAQY